MAKDDIFIKHIRDGFAKFNIDVEGDTLLDKDLHRIALTDNVNSVTYIALARRKDANKPEKFWSDVLDNILSPHLAAAAEDGGAPPAALVVPSAEGETIIEIAGRKGAQPTVYQLFDGYVVVGFRRFDSEKLINPASRRGENPSDRISDISPKVNSPAGIRADPPELSFNPSGIDSVPEAILIEQKPPAAKRSIPLKKLAAAVLLGVSIASIPFAVNRFPGGDISKDEERRAFTEKEEFVRDNILNAALEGREENEALLKILAQNAPLSGDDFRYLIEKGYAGDVAQNPALSDKLLGELATAKEPLLRTGVSANKNISGSALSLLAADNAPNVRRNAAKNPKLSAEEMLKLARNGDPLTRFAVLDNPNLTPEALDIIEPVYSDASCDNRAKIYASPCVNAAQLAYHKKNPDACIRRGVAQNPNTPEDVLRELADDSDPQAKRAALSNPSLKNYDFQRYFPVGWLSDDNLENKIIRQALLENPNIPAGLLKSAALNKPEELGLAAAKNPNTPEPILKALFNYAAGRGGVNGFLNEAAALTEDSDFLKRAAETDKRAPFIKSRLQRAFQKNIYDPNALVRFIRDETDQERGGGELVLGDFERGGEFFEEGGGRVTDGDLRLEENSGDFSEFFDDGDAFEKNLLETADRIVDDVIRAVSPLIENRLNSLSDMLSEPSKGVGNENNRFGGGGGGDALIGSPEGISPTGHGRAADRSIFSPELYQRTCQEVEKARRW
ncbi:MAG: hypothetical protein LBD73_08315 [Deferribacteraceae bacterium]|jgi:hypothetical protein|nr:hypothetical protein [Deferribacteraceae bacterium]